MKKIHLVLYCLFSLPLLAQTGIGTTTPETSAKLDVSSTNKGFLPPRVTLTSGTDTTTIPSPATGLLVYNTGNNVGLVAGYYYWNGASWATIATASGYAVGSSYLRGSRSAAQTTNLSVNSLVAFSQVDNVSGQEISLNTSTGQITLAAGRTYRLHAQVPNMSGGTRPAFAWYNETTSSWIGSQSSVYSPGDAASYIAFGSVSDAIITANTTTVVSYRIYSGSSLGSLGGNADFGTVGSYPWFDIQVISGNAPVTGQSVDYAIASLSANQTISAVGNVLFNTVQGVGITLNNGGFNLIANKTYKLEGSVGGSSTGYIYYAWVDASNTIISGGSIGSVIKAGGAFSDGPQDKAVAFYTPSTNTTVYLRVLTISGTSVAYPASATPTYSSTWATISQVGSSAFVSPWTLSGTNTFNTTGNVGIGTNSPSVALDVNGSVNANTLSLSNTTTTPSITVKNGDAALAYGDNAQIKMGWAGSPAGTSQYAQYIHTRHNAGPTENGIDFYLSDGTPNNTITNGSKRAMSITSPGDVDITGKLTIGNPSGNVATKAAGFVNAGTFVQMDNIKATITTSGNRGLSVAAVSTPFFCNIGATFGANGGGGGNAVYNNYVTTTPSDSWFGWGFGNAGDFAIFLVNDTTNNRVYRITMSIGASYYNNFISIERLF